MALLTPDPEQMIRSLGPQRPTDPPLLRRVRLHQSWYRSEVLGLPKWGVVASERGTPLGSILTLQDAAAGRNFIASEAQQAYEARRLTGWGVDPVRCERYLTSSQALTLNVLGPLFADARWSAKTFGRVLRRNLTDTSQRFIEFAPRDRIKSLGDRTIADAYVELQGANDQLGVVIETKYADGFAARDLEVAHRQSYLTLNERMRIWDSASPEFGTGKFDQLARVHALGSATYGSAISLLVLHHPTDLRTPEIAERYRRSLIDPGLIAIVDLGRFLGAMAAEAIQPAHLQVVEALRIRYVDHHLSEPSWLAWVSRNRKRGKASNR